MTASISSPPGAELRPGSGIALSPALATPLLVLHHVGSDFPQVEDDHCEILGYPSLSISIFSDGSGFGVTHVHPEGSISMYPGCPLLAEAVAICANIIEQEVLLAEVKS